MVFSASTVFAQSSVLIKREKLAAGDGDFAVIQVKDESEPAAQPVRVTVEVQCAGGVKKRVLNEKTCDFQRQEIKNKRLTVHLLAADIVDGETVCKDPYTKVVDLKTECEQKPKTASRPRPAASSRQ